MEDIQEQIEWLESIRINQLSNRALTIASKLARAIRNDSGVTVKLQSEAIAVRLSEEVQKTDNLEIKLLFRQFLEDALGVDTPSVNKEEHEEKKVIENRYYRGIKVE